MGEGGGCCFTHPPPSWVSTQIVPTCGLFHKGHAKGTFLPPPPFFGDQLQKPVPVSFKWTTVTVAPDWDFNPEKRCWEVCDNQASRHYTIVNWISVVLRNLPSRRALWTLTCKVPWASPISHPSGWISNGHWERDLTGWKEWFWRCGSSTFSKDVTEKQKRKEKEVEREWKIRKAKRTMRKGKVLPEWGPDLQERYLPSAMMLKQKG